MPDVRLIDANALLQECEKAYNFEDRRGQLAHCISAIKAAPTIDAQPVKHGKWRKRMSTSDSLKCCLCGYASIQESSYCGGCGAFMRGDAGD